MSSFSVRATTCEQRLSYGLNKIFSYFKKGVDLSLENKNIEINLRKLMDKYPDNMAVMDDISLSYPRYEHRDGKAKKILLISTYDLTDREKLKLKEDYIELLSDNIISFTGTGHLFTRINGKTLDTQGKKLVISNYKLPKSSRYEPLLVLSDNEMQSLNNYIRNIRANTYGTVGKMDGIPPDKLDPFASLTSNTPLVGTHNCTSWICSAPIGEYGETLSKLLKSKLDIGMPEQLMAWLTEKTESQRSPFSIYWTDRPVGHEFDAYLDEVEVAPPESFEDPHDDMFNLGF